MKELYTLIPWLFLMLFAISLCAIPTDSDYVGVFIYRSDFMMNVRWYLALLAVVSFTFTFWLYVFGKNGRKSYRVKAKATVEK